MSKEEGKNIAIKFTQPITPLSLSVDVPDDGWTLPSGIYSGSSQYSATYSPDKAFDGSLSTYWYTRTAAPQWVMVQLPEARKIGGFRFYNYGSYRVNGVKLYGSNDGTNFDLIITTSNPNVNGWAEHRFDMTIPYIYYKFEVTSNYGGYQSIYEINLLFTHLGSGNEKAFTVSGQEYLYTDGPNFNGPLQNKSYGVDVVKTHPTEPNSILIEIGGTGFRNVIGNIEVNYNQELGDLSGIGGAVISFTESFLPVDLIEQNNPGVNERINAMVSSIISFSYITKVSAYTGPERIDADISCIVQFIHIDDINP